MYDVKQHPVKLKGLTLPSKELFTMYTDLFCYAAKTSTHASNKTSILKAFGHSYNVNLLKDFLDYFIVELYSNKRAIPIRMMVSSGHTKRLSANVLTKHFKLTNLSYSLSPDNEQFLNVEFRSLLERVRLQRDTHTMLNLIASVKIKEEA